MIDINSIWYVLIGVVIAGYAVLDGFDLGVGILSLFGRTGYDRGIFMRAIGSVWDGNQVWLITAIGAFFAAFPEVYATVFSGFYVPLTLLLAALIFRSVSFEFHHHAKTSAGRRMWDLAFGLGSLMAAFLIGLSFGNILRGIPLDTDGNYTGTVAGLFNAYSVLLGVLTVVLFTLHGAVYMTLKTDGEIRARLVFLIPGVWAITSVLCVGAAAYTFAAAPFLFEGLAAVPLFYVLLAVLAMGFLAIPIAVLAKKYGWAFLATSGIVLSMVAMAGLSLYPRIIPARPDLTLSLTIYNAASTPRTLWVMFIIALIGMPLVIVYTAYVYWVFRGKVDLGEEGY